MHDPAAPKRGAAIHNFAFLVVGHALYKVISLVTLILIARYLGEGEFGRFIIALAAVQLADTVGDLGLSQAIVREGAGRREQLRVDLAAVLPVKLALGALSVAVAMAFVVASGGDALLVEMTFYFGLAQAAGGLTYLLRAVFQSFERMEYEALSVVLEGWVRLGAVLVAVVGRYGLVGIAKTLAVAAVVVLVASGLIMLHRFMRPRFTTGWLIRVRDLLMIGLPISLVWLAVGADQRINTLIVARISGDAAAGSFGAAFRLVEPTLIIPSMLIVALFPVAARHDRAGLQTMRFLLTSSQKMLLAISLPIATALWVTAPDIVTIVFGEPTEGVVTPLRILAPAVVLLFARLGITQMLLAVGRWQAALWPQVLALAANAVLALVLIPMSAAAGAAVAVLAGELAAVISGAYALRHDLGLPALSEIGRPVLIGAPVAAVAGVIAPSSVVAASLVAAAFYVVGMRLVRPFSRQDAAYLRSAMPLVAGAVSFATVEE